MGTKKVLFRRKFRGYDRRAVNDYILEMNRTFSEESRERDGALADAEKTLSESRERLASLEEALKARDDAVSADSEHIARLERELAALRAQCEEERAVHKRELVALRAQREKECKVHERELATLRAKSEEERVVHERELATLRAQSDEERTAHERELTILHAQNEEERAAHERELAILRAQGEEERTAHERELAALEAQLSALKAEYDLAAQQRIAALGTSCDQMRERMSAELRGLTKKCLREVLSGVAGMRDDIGRVQTTSGARADRMIRSIDEYEEDMKTEVRRLLNEFRADGLE